MLVRACSNTTPDPVDRVRRGVSSVRAKYPERRRTWLEHSADRTGDHTSGGLLRVRPTQEAPCDLSEQLSPGVLVMWLRTCAGLDAGCLLCERRS